MIKGIFWDNDGVLVETEHLYFQASSEVLGLAGVTLTREAFCAISLGRGESVLDLACHLPPEERETMRLARNARYAELIEREVRIIDGAKEVLHALHGRLRMAIVTSSRRDHFDLIHRGTGLLPYFDFVLTREDYNRSKPDPEPYRTALARSGLQAAECVVIEDSERGIAAARAAGLFCIAIPGGLTASADFSAADLVLTSIAEVPEVVLGTLPRTTGRQKIHNFCLAKKSSRS